jgi:DNA topoisomerase-2
MYQKRKDYLEGILEAEAKKLSNQARFIMEKCNQTLIVENKKRKTIVDELLKRGYAPDPVKEWKQRSKAEEEEQVPEEEEEEAPASEAGSSKKAPVDPGKKTALAANV